MKNLTRSLPELRILIGESANFTVQVYEQTVDSEVARVATPAFDDFSWPRYDKLWRISVIRVVVSFLFRITIRWINARGIWYLGAGQ